MRAAGRVKRLEQRLKARRAHCDECGGQGRVEVVYEGQPTSEQPEGCPRCGRALVVRILYES